LCLYAITLQESLTMKSRYLLPIALAALLQLPALGGGKTHEKTFELQVDDASFHLELEDVKDGASRTFKEKGHTVIATRKGDDLQLRIDGEALPDPATLGLSAACRDDDLPGGPGGDVSETVETTPDGRKIVRRRVTAPEGKDEALAGEGHRVKVIVKDTDKDLELAGEDDGDGKKVVKKVVVKHDGDDDPGVPGDAVVVVKRVVVKHDGDDDPGVPGDADVVVKKVIVKHDGDDDPGVPGDADVVVKKKVIVKHDGDGDGKGRKIVVKCIRKEIDQEGKGANKGK
jgi:hypothetical protein